MNYKNKLIRAMLISILIYAGVYLVNMVSESRERNNYFTGRIDKLEFNDKKTPSVTVHGTKYGLGTNWRFNEKLSVNDSLIKSGGSLKYKLIKFKTREVIYSDSL